MPNSISFKKFLARFLLEVYLQANVFGMLVTNQIRNFHEQMKRKTSRDVEHDLWESRENNDKRIT